MKDSRVKGSGLGILEAAVASISVGDSMVALVQRCPTPDAAADPQHSPVTAPDDFLEPKWCASADRRQYRRS